MSVALVRRNECVPKKLGSSPMLAIHSQTNRAYCRVMMGRCRPCRPPKRNSPGFLIGGSDVSVDRLSGLLRDFEPDRLAGLPLAHGRSGDRRTMRSNVLHPQADDVASSELAIDGQIEHGQVACSPRDLQLGVDRPA